MKNPKFSLIICGYNEEENLDLCIKSCLSQRYPKKDYEIIYIDNNSKDKSVKVARKYLIKVFCEKKQGLSEARNLGIKKARGEILVFLDADLKLDKYYLKNHEKTFQDNDVGAGGGKVLPLKETWVSNYLGVSLFEKYPRYKKFRNVLTYPGCNLTIRRAVLNEIGYFREGLKTAAGITRNAEDKEICERIREAGYKIRYNPQAVVYHENAYRLKKLVKIWVKGSKGRAEMIRIGKKDAFSLIFKYCLPLIGSLFFLIALVVSVPLAIGLLGLFILVTILLAINAFLGTGLLLQSFIVKPILDALALIIINLSVIYYRISK